ERAEQRPVRILESGGRARSDHGVDAMLQVAGGHHVVEVVAVAPRYTAPRPPAPTLGGGEPTGRPRRPGGGRARAWGGGRGGGGGLRDQRRRCPGAVAREPAPPTVGSKPSVPDTMRPPSAGDGQEFLDSACPLGELCVVGGNLRTGSRGHKVNWATPAEIMVSD